MAEPTHAPSAPWSAYDYTPSKAGAIFFTVAFALSTLFHLYQSYRYSSFKLTLPLAATTALLTAAFATRISLSSSFSPQIFTASSLLIHTAPPLLQLANLAILARLFHYVPYFAPMHPARMQLTFISLAAVIELLIIMGVAFVTNQLVAEKGVSMGEYMCKAGLIAEIIVTGLFGLLVGIFGYCCWEGWVLGKSKNVRAVLALLGSSMGLVLVRTAFRTGEMFAGLDSPVRREEWLVLVLDATVMLIGVGVWNVWHPKRFLPEKATTYLAQDGKTELQGPGWKDTRSLTETFLDPFAALTARGGHQKPFWERNGYVLKRRR